MLATECSGFEYISILFKIITRMKLLFSNYLSVKESEIGLLARVCHYRRKTPIDFRTSNFRMLLFVPASQNQWIAKGAGGKGPRQKSSKSVKKFFDNFRAGQKTSKIVKKCQKHFRHFSTIFARHLFSGPFWGGSDKIGQTKTQQTVTLQARKFRAGKDPYKKSARSSRECSC